MRLFTSEVLFIYQYFVSEIKKIGRWQWLANFQLDEAAWSSPASPCPWSQLRQLVTYPHFKVIIVFHFLLIVITNSVQPLVNFINILLTNADPKSAKNTVKPVFFALLGSAHVKVASRMLMKSTPCRQSPYVATSILMWWQGQYQFGIM